MLFKLYSDYKIEAKMKPSRSNLHCVVTAFSVGIAANTVVNCRETTNYTAKARALYQVKASY